MDEIFSSTIFLYGMALELAVGKAFTLTIWRTLAKSRPGLRQEMVQGRKDRRRRKQAAACQVQHPRKEPTADEPSNTAEAAQAEPHATIPAPIARHLTSEPP